MGFRTYLKTINKKELKHIYNFSENQIIDYAQKKDSNLDEIFLVHNEIGECIFQIYDVQKKFIDENHNYLLNETTNKLIEDYGQQLFKINKEGLKSLIDFYNEQIKINIQNKINNIEEAIKSKDNKEIMYLLEDIKRNHSYHISELEDKSNYILDNKFSIVDSQRLDLEIFNLITLYNNFNWEENILFIQAN